MKRSLLLVLAFSSQSFAAQVTIDKIEQAFMHMDKTELTQLTQDNQGYDKALAEYRLSLAYNLSAQQKNAINHLDLAQETLEKLNDEQPNNAEFKALLAQVYGLQISYHPMKGAYYGPKVGMSIDQAKQLNSHSPRVFLISGISDYNTPTMFGGSKKAAIKSFTHAIELYKTDGDSGYDWGNAEAYVWRGLSYMALQQPQKARQDWQTAVQLAPDYGWPKMLLQKNQ